MNCILFQTSYVHGYHKETHYQIVLQLWPVIIIVYFCQDQCTTQVWLHYKILAMDNNPKHILRCAAAVWNQRHSSNRKYLHQKICYCRRGGLAKNCTLFVATDTCMIRYPHEHYINHVKDEIPCTAPSLMDKYMWGFEALGVLWPSVHGRSVLEDGSECILEDKQLCYISLNRRARSKFRGRACIIQKRNCWSTHHISEL